MSVTEPRVVFLAGALAGDTVGDVRANIQRAADLARILWGAGFAAISPHLNSGARFYGVLDEPTVCAGYLEVLNRCDAVVLVPGWTTSKGTAAEVRYATERSIPVYNWESMDGGAAGFRVWLENRIDTHEVVESADPALGKSVNGRADGIQDAIDQLTGHVESAHRRVNAHAEVLDHLEVSRGSILRRLTRLERYLEQDV